MESLTRDLKTRASGAEETLKARDAELASLKADLRKQKETSAGAVDLAAANDRLTRENADLAQQLATIKQAKQEELKERDLMARAQLGSLSHADQMKALAIVKKINAHRPITFEENQRLTIYCGGSVARKLLFPQFEQAGEDAVNAWADKMSKKADRSSSKKTRSTKKAGAPVSPDTP